MSNVHLISAEKKHKLVWRSARGAYALDDQMIGELLHDGTWPRSWTFCPTQVPQNCPRRSFDSTASFKIPLEKTGRAGANRFESPVRSWARPAVRSCTIASIRLANCHGYPVVGELVRGSSLLLLERLHLLPTATVKDVRPAESNTLIVVGIERKNALKHLPGLLESPHAPQTQSRATVMASSRATPLSPPPSTALRENANGPAGGVSSPLLRSRDPAGLDPSEFGVGHAVGAEHPIPRATSTVFEMHGGRRGVAGSCRTSGRGRGTRLGRCVVAECHPAACPSYGCRRLHSVWNWATDLHCPVASTVTAPRNGPGRAATGLRCVPVRAIRSASNW